MRNRIICPEVAVIGQFLLGNSNFILNFLKKRVFENLSGKIEIF